MKKAAFLPGTLLACVLVAPASARDRKCDVFPPGKERAQCVCALQLGGRVTEVHNRWRVIYPRRHQERYCHNKVRGEGAPER